LLLQQCTSRSGYHSNPEVRGIGIPQLMRRKVKSIRTMCGVETYNNSSKCSLLALTQSHNGKYIVRSQPRKSLFGCVS